MSTNVVNTPGAPAAEREVDLLLLLGHILDHFKLIIGITACFALAALMYVLFATPIYQADALIQIEQKQGNTLLSNLSQMMPTSLPESAPDIQLLQSRMILGKTIDDLRLRNSVRPAYFPFFGRGWARLTGKQPGRVAISQLAIPQVQGASPKIILIAGRHNHYRIETPQFIARIALGERFEKQGLVIQVSDISARPGERFEVMQQTQLEAINDLQQRFSVTEKSKNSGLLSATITGSDPEQNAQILDHIVNNYLQQNIERQAAQDSKSLEFLKKQLPQVSQELDTAENKLSAYRKQQDSVDLNLEAKSVLEQIVNTDNQLNELTFREAEISQLYKKDHPTYRALIEKRQTLEREKSRLNKRVSAMPYTQQEVLRLSRDVESGRAVYLQLLNRRQELSIAESSAIGNVRIIDPAVSQPKPIKPKKVLVVVLFSLLGGIFSVGVVLAMVFLRRSIESPEELEEQGLNVYSTVPVSEWLQKRNRRRNRHTLMGRFRKPVKVEPFLAMDNPVDISVEAIRGLSTSLYFTMQDAPNNILMVSGATPGSGKTFVSSTLAAIIANTEQRVLYIDGDMRRGYSHNLFKVSNTIGLSTVLMGKAEFADAVQPFNASGGDIITRGPIPANPAELLMHERFRKLLRWANENYDVVIIDTPPVLAVTDASLAGRLAGTNLLIARFGMNTTKEVMTSIHRLETSGVGVRGVILNGVARRAGNYHGYYHYSYTSDTESRT